MTAIEKLYRFRCATAGATAVAGNVDWTETVDISEVGPVGGQRVEPKDASTSARPWTVTITDVAEDITARLADSDGRAQLLRRLCDFSVSTDGGSSWTVLATGRIDAVEMVGVSSFVFTVTDERLIERTTTIFEANNTTRIAPRGLVSAWAGYQPSVPFRFLLSSVDAVNNKSTYTSLGYTGVQEVAREALELLEDDVADSTAVHGANFTLARVNVAGTDRSINTLNGSPSYDPLRELRDRAIAGGGVELLSFTVSGYQDPGTPATTIRDVYFHMPGRTCTEDLPLHIGGQAGIDPFTLVKNIYDGDYQDASNPTTVRYNSACFTEYDESTNPQGLVDNPRFPKMHFRITGPANMAEWLQENIYGPLGVTPLINADGEVAPVFTRMPATDQVADPDALFTFDGTNSATHPNWLNQGRDQVTVAVTNFNYARPGRDFEDGMALDGFIPAELKVSRTHDNVGTAGRVVNTLNVSGMQQVGRFRTWARVWADELFNRFGDGPIYTTIKGMSATESVVQGDWVLLDLDSYPSLHNQSRSGPRLMQVMSRTDYPEGPEFELAEAGPNSQPLTAPTVSAAANAADDHTAIDVTVSGLSSGQGYEVHIAQNTTEPDEASDLWQEITLTGTTNETVTVPFIASGLTYWVRGRRTAPNRISSDWSTAVSQATTALTAPSSVADSDLSGDSATISWTNGETRFGTIVDLDGTFVALLRPGSTSYTFTGLDASTSYTAGVKHVDRYGGESARATDGFTTTGTATTLLVPNAVVVLVGGSV